MRLLRNILLMNLMLLAFWACSQDDDGPLNISSSNEVFVGKGFFSVAQLDSEKIIHLVGDTLYIHMDSIWAFSNCSMEKIGIENSVEEDSILVLKPIIHIRTSNEDCAAPYVYPDTVLKVVIEQSMAKGITTIRVMNNKDSLMDTIMVRRGEFDLDTFKIFIDTLFDSVHSLPLRTKGSPSVLRMVDSITPRVFLWRTMKTKCELRIDMCDSVRADTLFPSSWSLGDTNLVPVRMMCADSDLIYCHSSRWVNDSSALGEVQERPDTIWHTSTYYIEEIPECGSVDKFSTWQDYKEGKKAFSRLLFTPGEDESACGPSTQKDLYMYDIGRGVYMADTVDVDSIVAVWKKAKKARSK